MKRLHIIQTSIFLLASIAAVAQIDTSRKQSIDINSSYKPVLRNAVKIQFSASHLQADTGKSVDPYQVPAQQLFYSYQPVSLKPLALQADTLPLLGLRNFLKAGFGNYSSPFVQAGFSFGDGKLYLANVYAGYQSAKGNIVNQDYSQFHVKAAGSYFQNNKEWYGSVGLQQNDYYLYGYDHGLYSYSKEEALQRFMAVTVKAGLRNRTASESGINYNPNIQIDVFSSKDRVSESNLVAELPIEKDFRESFSVRLGAKADITSYTTQGYIPNNFKVNNNIFQISPELGFTNENLTIHAGLTPVWDNSELHLLPNIYGEYQLANQPFKIQAGWVGMVIKNSYQHLSSINPYLAPVFTQTNTRETEFYGGVKGSIGKHFNYSAKAAVGSIKNLPLFINDTAFDSKSFLISNEASVTNLKIHGDLSYINQDKFTITAGLTFNGYTGLETNNKAWGIIPLDVNASLRWWAFKQVLLKSDFRAFAGSSFVEKGNTSITLAGAADLSAGVEVGVTKKVSVWLDINNIFNNQYQRWSGYPVYGLQVMAGALVRF